MVKIFIYFVEPSVDLQDTTKVLAYWHLRQYATTWLQDWKLNKQAETRVVSININDSNNSKNF